MNKCDKNMQGNKEALLKRIENAEKEIEACKAFLMEPAEKPRSVWEGWRFTENSSGVQLLREDRYGHKFQVLSVGTFGVMIANNSANCLDGFKTHNNRINVMDFVEEEIEFPN